MNRIVRRDAGEDSPGHVRHSSQEAGDLSKQRNHRPNHRARFGVAIVRVFSARRLRHFREAGQAQVVFKLFKPTLPEQIDA